jgi:ABC-type nitrate/sulfonate/bicarbonate transport system substrate-binding protein
MASERQHSGGPRRRFLRRAGVIGVSVLALPAALAACGSDDDEPAGTATDGEPAAIDYQLAWIKSMQFAGPFMSTEHGYYDDMDLEVNLLGGGPSVDAITVVASGEATIGLADSNEIAVARGKGVPVVALAAAFQKSPFAMMSLSESPVLTLEDQYGKTVAVSDSSRPTVEALMEREGLDPGEVNFVPKNPDPSVLADGQVDAYWGFVTSEAAVLSAQGVEIESVLLADLGETTYANTYFVTEETLENDRDLIVDLLAADLAGWQWAVDNPDEAAEIVNESYQDEDEELDVMLEQSQAQLELITAGDGDLLAIDEDVFEANITSALDSGLIDEAFEVSDVVDTTVLDDARADAPA